QRDDGLLLGRVAADKLGGPAPSRPPPSLNLDLNLDFNVLRSGILDARYKISDIISFTWLFRWFGTLLTASKMNGDGKPWVVISDVDETIKASSTLSVLHYMGFVLMGRPIHGMPEAFRYLAMRLTPKFFYVSAGPSLLYYHFVSFINSYYPPGHIFLAPWEFGISLLIDSKLALINYKSTRIDLIFQSEKSSRVLCIGDDGQED